MGTVEAEVDADADVESGNMELEGGGDTICEVYGHPYESATHGVPHQHTMARSRPEEYGIADYGKGAG